MERFCDRLNEAIEKAELTPAELSRRTGIGEGAISCYRNGTYKAGQKNTHKLAVTLGVSIPWLMGLDVPIGPSDYEIRQQIIERVQNATPGQLAKIVRILDLVEDI